MWIDETRRGCGSQPTKCTYGTSVADISIQMFGGPGAARLTVRADDVEWLYGFTDNRNPTGQEGENPFVIARVEPSERIEFTAHLRIEPNGGRDVILPLTITASYGDQVGEWTRQVPVRMRRNPQLH